MSTQINVTDALREAEAGLEVAIQRILKLDPGHAVHVTSEAKALVVVRQALSQCNGCAVQQGYMPAQAVVQIQEPERNKPSMSMHVSVEDYKRALTDWEAEQAQLAAVQQGVQPQITEASIRAVALKLVGVDPDAARVFADAAIKPYLEQARELLEVALATHPTQQGLANDGMYYLQDARWSAMVGNCPSFWREGGGYTTNLDEAERFTLDAAMKQHKCRQTDLPWLCAEVDKLRRPTVDCQYMPRSWDEQRAALAAQAKQGEQANG